MNPDYRIPHALSSLWLSLCLVFIVGCTVDMFVPSLPNISESLHATNSQVKLIVAVYLLSYGICQLFAGSLSDRFGRKSILIVSLSGLALSLYATIFSHSIQELLAYRLLQGIFSAGVGVVSRAIVTDSFAKNSVPRYASYITFSWAAGVIISPFLGGLLQHHFGWQASFLALGIYCTLCFFLILFLFKETIAERHSLSIKTFKQNYATIFKHPVFMLYILICGLAYSLVTIYNVLGPFLIQTSLHYNAVIYGVVALALGISWLCGTLTFRFVAKKPCLNQYIEYITFALVITTCLFFMLSLFIPLNIYVMVITPMLIYIFGGVMFAYGFGHSLSIFPTMAGSASAAAGFTYVLMAGISSGLSALLKTQSSIPLGAAYFTIAAFILVLFIIVLRINKIQQKS